MFSHRTRVTIAAAVGVATLMTPVMFDGLVHADQISDQRTRVAQITDQLEALEQQADTLAEDYTVAVDELNGLEWQPRRRAERAHSHSIVPGGLLV